MQKELYTHLSCSILKWLIQLTFPFHMSTNCAVNEPMLCGPSRCMYVVLECFELLKTTEFN